MPTAREGRICGSIVLHSGSPAASASKKGACKSTRWTTAVPIAAGVAMRIRFRTVEARRMTGLGCFLFF